MFRERGRGLCAFTRHSLCIHVELKQGSKVGRNSYTRPAHTPLIAAVVRFIFLPRLSLPLTALLAANPAYGSTPLDCVGSMARTPSDNSPRSSGKNDSGTIINRRRELNGLPNSFSSSLGRDVERSPRQRHRRDVGPGQRSGRSVKSIVAWLESAPLASDPNHASRPLPKDETDGSRQASNGSPSLACSPRHSWQNTCATRSEEEDSSLAFLKYRKYFTETPLGRCLDEDANERLGVIQSSNEAELATEDLRLAPSSLPTPSSNQVR